MISTSSEDNDLWFYPPDYVEPEPSIQDDGSIYPCNPDKRYKHITGWYNFIRSDIVHIFNEDLKYETYTLDVREPDDYTRLPNYMGGVYVVTYKQKVLYVGKTENSFRHRWANHKMIKAVKSYIYMIETPQIVNYIYITNGNRTSVLGRESRYFQIDCISSYCCRYGARITEAILIKLLKPKLNQRA